MVFLMLIAGCGKTSLLKFLAGAAGVQLCVLNVHGGTSSSQILQAVDRAEQTAAANPGLQVRCCALLVVCMHACSIGSVV
jgi:midasin (ATPase involved in ribosome maturation)